MNEMDVPVLNKHNMQPYSTKLAQFQDCFLRKSSLFL